MISTIFLSSAAVLAVAQAGGESATSIYADEPKTWTLEYPVAITPFVDDYYNCLKSGMRTVRIEPEFEAQHRSDLPRCMEVKANAIADANALLSRRGRDDEGVSPAEVAQTFDTIENIHIERGRDLDDHIRLRAEARDRYWAEHRETEAKRKVTVVDLDIGSTATPISPSVGQPGPATIDTGEADNASN